MKKLFVLLCVCFCAQLFSSETVFLLIRHGQTDWNIEDRAQGHTNNPLNERGMMQAKNLAERIASSHSDITSIYSSDLDRAYTTAQETAKKLNLEVEKRESLREINNGAAEGLTLDEEELLYGPALQELNKRYPHRQERWNYTHIPNAETNHQLLHRIKNELMLIEASHKGEKVAVFAHGEIIKVLIADILDTENIPPIPNCAVVQIVYSSDTQAHPFTFIAVE
ncbi:MAG: histidine phosphatase family protein [Chlamydiota bacterium]